MIGILDYGVGNVGSIQNMLKKAGASSLIVHAADELSTCDKLILPGVGAFDDGMDRLDQSGMRTALDGAVTAGKPVLGICLGMQMLGLSSEEGRKGGLGYIPFRCLRFHLEEFPELKKRYWGRHFWARGYFCVTVGDMTEEMIQEYLEHHFEPDPARDFRVEP